MVTKDKSIRSPHSLTKKGRATRKTILDAANDVFKSKGFYAASVSEIARRCGISMGSFYQYFRNKEQVFMELNDLIISEFSQLAENLPKSAADFDDRLRSAVGLLLDHTRKNFAFHCVLGESELIDRVTIGYYEAIARVYRDFFRREAAEGNVRSLDPNMIAYGLISICYFNSKRWKKSSDELTREEILERILSLAMDGISGTASYNSESGYNRSFLPEPKVFSDEPQQLDTKGERTRKDIFLAAEKVFGRSGIHRANIAEITREAGVAQGTFYIHFKSKTDLIEGFVQYINHKMRRYIQRLIEGIPDRRDSEWMGILSFLEFAKQHRQIYRIVPEYEMIGREAGLWYYNKIARGYIKGLKKGIDKKQIRDLNSVFLARSLMGISHFIGLKWIIWTATPQPIQPQLLKDIREFMLFGLRSR